MAAMSTGVSTVFGVFSVFRVFGVATVLDVVGAVVCCCVLQVTVCPHLTCVLYLVVRLMRLLWLCRCFLLVMGMILTVCCLPINGLCVVML